jgi:hypothetical protein
MNLKKLFLSALAAFIVASLVALALKTMLPREVESSPTPADEFQETPH